MEVEDSLIRHRSVFSIIGAGLFDILPGSCVWLVLSKKDCWKYNGGSRENNTEGLRRAVWHRLTAEATMAVAVAPPVFQDWKCPPPKGYAGSSRGTASFPGTAGCWLAGRLNANLRK